MNAEFTFGKVQENLRIFLKNKLRTADFEHLALKVGEEKNVGLRVVINSTNGRKVEVYSHDIIYSGLNGFAKNPNSKYFEGLLSSKEFVTLFTAVCVQMIHQGSAPKSFQDPKEELSSLTRYINRFSSVADKFDNFHTKHAETLSTDVYEDISEAKNLLIQASVNLKRSINLHEKRKDAAEQIVTLKNKYPKSLINKIIEAIEQDLKGFNLKIQSDAAKLLLDASRHSRKKK